MIALLLAGCALLAAPHPVYDLVVGDPVCQPHRYSRSSPRCVDLLVCTRLDAGAPVAWVQGRARGSFPPDRFPAARACAVSDRDCMSAARVGAEQWACSDTR
jgi:hypothetical protein